MRISVLLCVPAVLFLASCGGAEVQPQQRGTLQPPPTSPELIGQDVEAKIGDECRNDVEVTIDDVLWYTTDKAPASWKDKNKIDGVFAFDEQISDRGYFQAEQIRLTMSSSPVRALQCAPWNQPGS